ncbi:MAG: sensor histidine kinase, partial [Oceanobacter sp.]
MLLTQPLTSLIQKLNHLGFGDHPLADQMQWERHHLFMKEVGSRMAATFVACLLVGFLFVQSASIERLSIWFSMNLFVGLNSWLILRRYHQQPHRQQEDTERYSQPLPEQQRTIQKWHLANLYLSLLWGFQWAALPLLFLGDASIVQIFSILLLVTITSTMPSMSMGLYPDVYVTFLTPVLGAFGWHLMSMDLGDVWLHKAMAPAVWLSLVGFSFAMFKTQIQALATRLELQHSKREVEQANHAKTRFLAAASHDLRQPLQAASMYWSAMDTPTDDNQARMFKRMGSSLNAASDMLSALLDLSRMDSGSVKPVMTAVSLNALINELNTVFRPLATQKKLQLNWIIPDHCQILCDRQMMMQILKNLIANAIQYTEKGSVEIQAWQQGNSLTISVRDTGLGIPADQQADIFEEFVQLHNSARQREKGMGLGLSIVS